MSGEYTVSLRAPFASHWSKSRHGSFASALSNAWRKRNRDFSVDNVSRERKVIVSHETLARAFTEMDNLSREQPELPTYELAEQIIQTIDNEITQDEMWERMNFIKAVHRKGA